jgi:hypothetical protein
MATNLFDLTGKVALVTGASVEAFACNIGNMDDITSIFNHILSMVSVS